MTIENWDDYDYYDGVNFLFSFRCYYYVWMPVISYDLMEFSFIVHVPTYEDKISVNGIVHPSFLFSARRCAALSFIVLIKVDGRRSNVLGIR